MRLTANRADLADAVKWVAGAIDSKRPSSPAMSGIHLEADADGITLTGHDFDKLHTARVAAEVTEPGTAVPVALMVRDLLNALKGKTVELSLEANAQRMTLKSGRSSYAVSVFAPGTWPLFPVHDLAERGTLDADELRRCVAAVAPSADDHNPVSTLRGVRLEAFDADELAVVGCSTTRLSVAVADWGGDPFTSQVPLGSVTDAARGLAGEVTVSTSDGALGLADGHRSVVLRVYDAENYPQWRRLIVEPRDAYIEVDAKVLRDACKRASLAGAGQEPLTLAIKGGEVKVSTSGDAARGSESFDYDGNLEHSADFSASVLLPVLASLPPTPVRLSFEASSSGRPLLLTDKAGSFRHVLMPRRGQA